MTTVRLYTSGAELAAHYAAVRQRLGMGSLVNIVPRSMIPRLPDPGPEYVPPPRKRKKTRPPRLPASIDEIRRSIRSLDRVRKKAARYIIVDVAERDGILIDDILGQKRFPYLFFARAEIAARLRELKFSYEEIGAIMHRDHSSVVHMVRRFNAPEYRKNPQKTRQPENDVRVTG